MEIKDQLSWNDFIKISKEEKVIKKVKPFNRLIGHTKNLFIIAGYGSFVEGYVLIITKDFMPSFGLINSKILDELNFLIKLLKFQNKEKYQRKTVLFEHGMCACIGGLDRAHLHIMGVNKNSNKSSLKNSIEKVLYKRKVGIKYIKFGNYKLENIHDINQFMDDLDAQKNNDFKIEGKLFKLNDIKNLDEKKWPSITLKHINKGGHYVYFSTDYPGTSFLTTENFQTQFGRQVVYENEIATCNNFQKKNDKFSEN